MKKTICLALMMISTFSCSNQDVHTAEKEIKPHVLFISIDDFRPELGIYGSEIAVTPNLDRIAQNGVRFSNAYAQQAICGPSRASTMTGVRPDTLEVTHNYVKFRHKMQNVQTIPQHFMNNGYVATHVGKIFHHGDKDEQLSWNWQPAYNKLPKNLEKPQRYADKKNIELQKAARKEMFAKYGEQAKYGLGSGPAFEKVEVPDNSYEDGYNTDLAIATLKDMLGKTDKPIFFGFGMNKPHLPWVAPKKYWDMYDPKDIPLAKHRSGPKDGAAMGLHASFELRTFSNIPKEGDIPDDLALELKHSYLASVSYIDAQIGRIMAAFEQAGILDNTIVVVWSDHGYHLGEMGIWGKASNYEIAARVPLIISTPKMKKNQKGTISEALVELIDVYPTLSELSSIPLPQHLEGQSFAPLLTQPKLKWKSAVFSQFPSPALREWGAFPLRKGMRETYFGPLIEEVEQRIKKQQGVQWDRELFEHYLMGYSMRTERYRIIAWKDTRKPELTPLHIELFDHSNDPDETTNIAKSNPALVNELIIQLNAGWQGNKAPD